VSAPPHALRGVRSSKAGFRSDRMPAFDHALCRSRGGALTPCGRPQRTASAAHVAVGSAAPVHSVTALTSSTRAPKIDNRSVFGSRPLGRPRADPKTDHESIFEERRLEGTRGHIVGGRDRQASPRARSAVPRGRPQPVSAPPHALRGVRSSKAGFHSDRKASP
jgi:hypothetical protein